MEAARSFVRLINSTRLNGITEQHFHRKHEGSMTFSRLFPSTRLNGVTEQHFHPKHEGSMIFRQAAPLYQTTRCHKTEDTMWMFVSVFCLNIWGVLFPFLSLCYEFLISIPLHSASYYYYFIFGGFFLYFVFPTLHLHLYCSQFFSFLPCALSSSLYVSRNSLKD